VFAIASILFTPCSEFVNSFARRQHLFEMAAKPIEVESNFFLVSHYLVIVPNFHQM